MIRKNLIDCKLIPTFFSGLFHFDNCMDSFNPEAETCPICGCRGRCHIHAYYYRYLVDFDGSNVTMTRIRVLRLICSCCGATHAILPDPIIPYCTYTLFFILQVLRDRFCHLLTIEHICQKYCISSATYYKWLKIFDRHKREWLGYITDLEQDRCTFITGLEQNEPFSAFTAGFFNLTCMTFLQIHKNPAPYHRIPQIGKSVFA